MAYTEIVSHLKGTDLPYKLADAAAVAEHTDVYVFGGVSEDADGLIIPMKEPGSSITHVNSLPVTLSDSVTWV